MNPHQTHPHDGKFYHVTLDRPEPKVAAPVVEDDTDVRRVPVDWRQVVELVEGVKRQGFTDAQREYFVASLGLCWAKATLTERARAAKERG